MSAKLVATCGDFRLLVCQSKYESVPAIYQLVIEKRKSDRLGNEIWLDSFERRIRVKGDGTLHAFIDRHDADDDDTGIWAVILNIKRAEIQEAIRELANELKYGKTFGGEFA